jgi:hypothetical protein
MLRYVFVCGFPGYGPSQDKITTLIEFAVNSKRRFGRILRLDFSTIGFPKRIGSANHQGTFRSAYNRQYLSSDL